MRVTTVAAGFSLAGLALFVYGIMPLCGCSTKAPAYAAAMKSDLKNLDFAQERHFEEHGTYTTDLAALDFGSSSGVTVTILHADAGAWAARATHGAFETGRYAGADCVAGRGTPRDEARTTIKHRSPTADRAVVCDLDGWGPVQSRWERWRWKLND